MPETPQATPDTPGSVDFLLGQMSQSIHSLHEELSHIRADLKRMAENYATRNELEQVKTDVAELETFQRQTVTDFASRKWIDRLVVGGIAIVATTLGGYLATAFINPLIIP